MQEEQAPRRLNNASERVGKRAATDSSPHFPDKRWFAYVAGQSYGPYAEPEIRRMAENGQIQESDFICIDGDSAWRLAKDEPLLTTAFQSQAERNGPAVHLPADIRTADPTTNHFQAPQTKRRHDYQSLFQSDDQDRIREDLSTFFGPRADKYLAIYEKMRARNKPFVQSWNWIVFFTSFPWFFYRKMYLAGALLIFVPAILSYLFGPTGIAGAMAGVAIVAKNQYVLSGLSRIRKADALGLSGEDRRDYLRQAGGVSVVAGVLTGLLFTAVFALAILGAYLKHHKAAH